MDQVGTDVPHGALRRRWEDGITTGWWATAAVLAVLVALVASRYLRLDPAAYFPQQRVRCTCSARASCSSTSWAR